MEYGKLLKKRVFFKFGLKPAMTNGPRNNNKLEGHGFGISIITINQMKFDICIGLNHFGSRTIHFIKNIN